ncbi:MAG: hypothetical protein AAGJ08_09725 [Cyanobacteria bacterium P01_H01_bin.35]
MVLLYSWVSLASTGNVGSVEKNIYFHALGSRITDNIEFNNLEFRI